MRKYLLVTFFALLITSCTFATSPSSADNDSHVSNSFFNSSDQSSADSSSLSTSSSSIETETYTIKFKSEDGETTLQSSEVEYGGTPSYSGATPTKASTATEVFTFDGWSSSIGGEKLESLPAVTGAATYYAHFTTDLRKYTVIWKNYDGTILETDELSYGAIPIYDGVIPTRPEDAKFIYIFDGWTPFPTSVVKNEEYLATFLTKEKGKTIHINYELNGGANDPNNPITYQYGTEPIKLNKPSKEGDLFDGWYLEPTFETEVKQLDINATDNMVLYAKWCGLENINFSFSNSNNRVIIINSVKNKNELITLDLANIRNYKVIIQEIAFSGCTALTSITLPKDLESIKSGTFTNCTSLTSITIPSSVKSIAAAFIGCKSLTSINIPDITTWFNIYHENEMKGWESSPFDYPYNLYLNGELVENLVIPNNVESIGDNAFSGCASLTTVTIPDSVTSIGNNAFYNCKNLKYNKYDNAKYLGNDDNPYLYLVRPVDSDITSCIINTDCKHINGYAFKNCYKLIYNEYDNAEYLGNYDNPYLYLVRAKDSDITSCIINTDCKFIGTGAFWYRSKLGSLNIPDTVTSIGNYAFEHCESLKSIKIPRNVKVIRADTFYYCKSLTSITIPNGVTSIGEYAFYHCESLTSITIPKSIKEIGSSAFVGVDIDRVNITDITAWCNISFIDSASNPFYIEEENNNLYLNGSLVKNLVIPDTVTSIGDYAFLNLSSLTSITIPDTVTSIGRYAFAWCISLTSITLPDTVTSIGDCAFISCIKLGSITIPDTVTSIGYEAFSNCSSLTSINIPISVTSIGKDAFKFCSSLTIYCEAESKPAGWDSDWNPHNRPVVWGYTHS